MKLVYLTDEQNLLNDFIVKFSPKSFLQTYEWGEFQKSVGRQIWRLAVLDDNSDIQFAATLVLHKLPIKNYFYCPFGPVFHLNLPSLLVENYFKLFLDEVKNLANKNNVIFLKIDPQIFENNKSIVDLLDKFKFKKSNKEIQPKNTLLLDLRKSKEWLMSSMKPKMRYNINLSVKKGVKIVEGNLSNFEDFYKLLRQTALRDKFSIYPKDYYLKMLEKFLNKDEESENRLRQPFVKLFFSKLEDKFIATAIVLFFSEYAFYLHGGFNYDFRSFFPSALLQWEIIKKSKEMGYHFYDFWGIDEDKENWRGITRFKKGFGGEKINYLGAYDFIFHPFYWKLYNLARKFKWLF